MCMRIVACLIIKSVGNVYSFRILFKVGLEQPIDFAILFVFKLFFLINADNNFPRFSFKDNNSALFLLLFSFP